MNRIYGRNKIVNLVHPVNPVEKTFVLFRVALWKNIFLPSIVAGIANIGICSNAFILYNDQLCNEDKKYAQRIFRA